MWRCPLSWQNTIPFKEKAGMRKIAEQPPPKEAIKIAETLSELGFNIHLLGSEKYVLSRLRARCLSLWRNNYKSTTEKY